MKAIANPQRKREMDELRRSSAASPHVLSKNKGTRSSREVASIRQSLEA